MIFDISHEKIDAEFTKKFHFLKILLWDVWIIFFCLVSISFLAHNGEAAFTREEINFCQIHARIFNTKTTRYSKWLKSCNGVERLVVGG